MRAIRFIPVLCGLWLAPSLSAQPLADRLPATTLVYTGWSPIDALHDTKAAKMLADQRLVQPWRGVVQRLLLSSLQDEPAGAPALGEHLPHLLSEAAECEGCFALLEL